METEEADVTIDFTPILGVFLNRLNRFMVLVEVDNKKVYAHLPNSGRLSTVLYSGAAAYLRKHEKRPKRKTSLSLFAIQHPKTTVIVDAQFSNFLARRAIEQSLFKGLVGYNVVKENFRVYNSNVRLDLMLEKNAEKFYLEVKSVTYAVNGVALFPDAPTLRGRKHIQQLDTLLKQGYGAGILFSVQRADANLVKPNVEVDPKFTALLKRAAAEGLEIFTLNSIFQPPKNIKIKANTPTFTF